MIGGKNEKENLEILEMVLERIAKYYVHLKLSKCIFLRLCTQVLNTVEKAWSQRNSRSKL